MIYWIEIYKRKEKIIKKKRDANSTQCSQAVTHPSTNRAQHCLTSVIGRELVCSMWYGRWRELYIIWTLILLIFMCLLVLYLTMWTKPSNFLLNEFSVQCDIISIQAALIFFFFSNSFVPTMFPMYCLI